MTRRIHWLMLLVMVSAAGCTLPEDGRELIRQDFVPPQFISATGQDAHTVVLEFDSPVYAADELLLIGPYHAQVSGQGTGTVQLHIEPAIPPGTSAMLEGTFRDGSGNQLHLITPIYGYNADAASLVINEFTTRGSQAHPDRVELLAAEGGSTAGITFFDGTKHDYRQKKMLPDISVESGDFVIIHCRPESSAWEDETEDRASSSHPGSHDEAWDVFIPGGRGLSANNGVLTLYDTPDGTLTDGVFYSDRTSESDDRYRGFGSPAMLNRVEMLCREQGWEALPEEVRPEDGIDSSESSATRSMSRLPGSFSGTNEDWITVPTRGSTFGQVNGTDEYRPD